MPRLRNTKTEQIVSCDEETAARLGSEWETVGDSKAPVKKTASSKSASSKSDD